MAGIYILRLRKGIVYEPSDDEISKDRKFLGILRVEWEKVIRETKHSDQTLQIISSETRNELKSIAGIRTLFRRDREQKERKTAKAVLFSKYIYLMIKEIYEDTAPSEFQVSFFGKIIEVDTDFLVHTINRHYAELIKEDSSKSFHTDIDPFDLPAMMKGILQSIETSGVFNWNGEEKIAFRFKEIPYHLWVKPKEKYVKGKGKVEYLGLKTLYEVDQPRELDELNQNYCPIKISNHLAVYSKT